MNLFAVQFVAGQYCSSLRTVVFCFNHCIALISTDTQPCFIHHPSNEAQNYPPGRSALMSAEPEPAMPAGVKLSVLCSIQMPVGYELIVWGRTKSWCEYTAGLGYSGVRSAYCSYCFRMYNQIQKTMTGLRLLTIPLHSSPPSLPCTTVSLECF